MIKFNCSLSAIALGFALHLTTQAIAQDAKTWTDATGKFKIQATFLGLESNQVVLKKTDGSQIKVPLTKLSQASQKMAQAEVARLAKSSTDKPQIAQSSASTTMRDDMTAEEFVGFVKDRMVAQDFSFAWDAMPATYQSDLSAMCTLAGDKLDYELHNEVVATKKQILGILQSKKKFILKNQALAMLPAPILAKAYDPVVNAVDAMLDVETFSPSAMKSGDVKLLLNQYIGKVVPAMESLSSLASAFGVEQASAAKDIEKVTYTIENVDSNTAVVTYKAQGQKQQQATLVRVEGKWVPKELADSWAEAMSNARSQLESLTPEMQTQAKAQLREFRTSALSGLEKAKSQQEFDLAIQPLTMMAMLFSGGMQAGFGGPNGQGFGPNGPGFGQDPNAPPPGFDPSSFQP